MQPALARLRVVPGSAVQLGAGCSSPRAIATNLINAAYCIHHLIAHRPAVSVPTVRLSSLRLRSRPLHHRLELVTAGPRGTPRCLNLHLHKSEPPNAFLCASSASAQFERPSKVPVVPLQHPLTRNGVALQIAENHRLHDLSPHLHDTLRARLPSPQ